MSEQISKIQTREVLELMRNLGPILNQKELFEFMLFSNRVMERYMSEHHNDELSEEVTEMRKDKAWMKEEIWKQDTVMNKGYIYTDDLMSIVNELDEPETPTIPKFVADYYKEYQNHELTFSEWFESPPLNKGSRAEKEIFKWLLDNEYETNLERQFILADIIAHGLNKYEVEKEKRYFIIEPVTGQLLIRDDSQSTGVKWADGFPTSPSYFTEKEIKAIDERYWVFAEEVTE